jgi:tripartite-type tricarboxylate transporter receptor subunit TctC
MFGEMFRHAARIDILHIPYKGGPQALTALISGEVEMLMGQIPPVSPFLKSGRVRGIAVSGTSRASALPQVPTFEESGLKGLESVIWYVLSAPTGLPPDIVTRLNRELNRGLSSPELRARFASEGLDPFVSTPEEATRFVRAEIPRWAEAVKLSGAKPD